MGIVTFSGSDVEADDGDLGHSGDDDDDFAPSPMPTVSPGSSRRTRASTRAMPHSEAAVPRSSQDMSSSSQGDVVLGHITEYPGFSVHHRTVAGLVEHTFHPAADPSISYTDGCTHVSLSNNFCSLCNYI